MIDFRPEHFVRCIKPANGIREGAVYQIISIDGEAGSCRVRGSELKDWNYPLSYFEHWRLAVGDHVYERPGHFGRITAVRPQEHPMFKLHTIEVESDNDNGRSTTTYLDVDLDVPWATDNTFTPFMNTVPNQAPKEAPSTIWDKFKTMGESGQNVGQLVADFIFDEVRKAIHGLVESAEKPEPAKTGIHYCMIRMDRVTDSAEYEKWIQNFARSLYNSGKCVPIPHPPMKSISWFDRVIGDKPISLYFDFDINEMRQLMTLTFTDE